MEATRDDDTVVQRKNRISGDDMRLGLRMGTDLAGEGEGAEATGDGDGLVTVSVNDLRGKKPDGAAPSVRHR